MTDLRPSRWVWAALFGVLAAGIYFRCDLLGSKVFWQDEQWTLELVQKSPLHQPFWDYLHANVSTAPLEYLMLHAFTRLVPGVFQTPWLLRLPACVYGILGLFVFAFLLKKLFPLDAVSVVAGTCLYAFQLPLTFYAQEARPYSFWVLLIVIHAHCWLRLMYERGLDPMRLVLPLCLVNTLLLQTASGSLFYVGLTSFAWWWSQPNEVRWTNYGWGVLGLAVGVPVLLGAPWVLHSSNVHYEGNYGLSEAIFNVKVFYGTLGGGLKLSNILLWTLLAFGTYSAWKDQEKILLGLAAAAWVASGVVMVTAWRCNLLLSQRYLLFAVPATLLVVTYGIHRAPQKWRAMSVALVVTYSALNVSFLLRGLRL